MKIETPASYSPDLDLDLSWAIAVLRRRRLQISAFIMIALAGAALAIAITPPVFTSSAVLLLETQPPGLFRPNSIFSDKIDQSMVDTQVEVLRSSQILLRVVDDMKLLESAEFKPETVTIPSPVELLRGAKNWITDQLASYFGTPGKVAAPPETDDPRRDVLAKLLEHLAVSRVGGSNTILISYTAENPATAAAIVNRLAHVYITSQLAWQPENAEAEIPQIEDRIVITKASPPLFPSGPRKVLILAGALLAGLFTGLATAFAREWLDESLQSPDQIERITAARCLTVIPRLAPRRQRLPDRKDNPPKSFASSSLPIISEVQSNPVSTFSDGVRRIAVCVRNNRTSPSASRIVALTSADHGEGKTTLAISVALLLAQTQGPTLLIDGDLRHRGATRLLAPEASIGLRDGVNATFPLPSLLWADTDSPLRFLPSIVSGLPEHPADILGAPGMDQLLRQAAKTFRNIIIDLPAMGAVIDAQAISPSLDAIVIVVAKGSPAGDLAKVLESAPGLREKLAGTVMNLA